MSHSSAHSRPPIILDRLTVALVGALSVAVIIVHIDKFQLGAEGPQRAHDGGDIVVTSLAECGAPWRDPTALWNPTVARGWPALYGTFPPQYLGCFAAAYLPLPVVWPLLQVLIVSTIAVGTLLFFRLTLGYSHTAAFAGALFQAALFYWFHENDVATSATLLLPLVGFLSVRGSPVAFLIALAGLVLFLGLAVPTGTLILVPSAHLLLILTVVPRSDRWRHLYLLVGFWAVYGLFYLPALVGYVTNADQASRSLFTAAQGTASVWDYFSSFWFNPSVVTSGLVLMAFVDRKTWRGTAVALGVVLTILVLVSLNQFYIVQGAAARYPLLLGVSTMYYRVYYMISVVVCLWGGYLLSSAEQNSRMLVVIRRLCLVGLVVLTAGVFLRSEWPAQYTQLPLHAAWIGVTLAILPRLKVRNFLAAAAVATVFLFPLRQWFTEGWESPWQGNVFLEGPPAESSSSARVVTVQRTCDASDIFPAQAAAQGRETLDGNSNFYHADFVRRWRYFVTERSTGCTARYARWNTRIETTPEDFARDPERILLWWWINGVDEVRSPAPLTHPDLQLLEAKPIDIHWHGRVTRYRYLLRAPLSRVFQLPPGAAASVGGPEDFAGEERLLRDLRTTRPPEPVPLESYSGSRYLFSGVFQVGEILISSSTHAGWRLWVDGQPAELTRGPFGMIAVAPMPGWHRYEVVFQDGYWVPTVTAMGMGLLALGVLVGRACRVEVRA